MSQFKKIWAPIATLIGAVLLANQLVQSFKGDRSLTTGTLILVSLVALGGGMWNYAFAKSTVPGIPRYRFHWLAKIALVVILASTLIPLDYILTILEVVPDCCNVLPTSSPTLTAPPTHTKTSVPTFTFTPTPSAIPTPEAQGHYYMVVLDASQNMLDTFDGVTKWYAAREAVRAVLEGRESGANYGLVVVGGSPMNDGDNPCDKPASLTMPFSSRDTILDHIDDLQPSGGGSIYKAFTLAKEQFEPGALPENTVHTLIFITGSRDACLIRDEWQDIRNAYQFSGGIGVELYSEIIVLEQDELKTRTIEQQIGVASDDLNVQVSQNTTQLYQSITNVFNNVTNHINITSATKVSLVQTSSAPAVTPPTQTDTPTPRPTYTSANPMTVYPTFTLTSTRTATPSFTPVSPTVTPTFDTSPVVIDNKQDVKDAALNCSSGSGCVVYVNVRWISADQAQLQGKHLSIWVRPWPNDVPDGACQEYWPQNAPAYNTENGIWSIQTHIGVGSEPDGAEFSITALVTNETYIPVDVKKSLPSSLDSDGFLVDRGSGNPPPPTCP